MAMRVSEARGITSLVMAARLAAMASFVLSSSQFANVLVTCNFRLSDATNITDYSKYYYFTTTDKTMITAATTAITTTSYYYVFFNYSSCYQSYTNLIIID